MVGASGFLGRHVVPELRSRGHEVVAASRSGADGEALDVTDAAGCADVVARVHPGVVLNLAGAGVTAGSAGEDEMARVNLDGPGNVADAAARHGARLVHVASSTEPLAGHLPESVYSRTKADGTARVARAMEDGDARICIARVHNAYGADQPRGRFVGDVIRHMAAGGEFTVRYPGRIRDFCLVDDVAARLADLASDPDAHGQFDIGTGTGVSLLRAATMIRDGFGAPDAQLHWAEGPAADPAPSSVAGDAGLTVLTCPTTLADGLERLGGRNA